MIEPPRIRLAQLPTPVHRLDRLSEDLGLDLWIKRDDLTGLAMGGNKARKLEYIMADLVARRVQAVVTCGAAQSNFVRQLGAACSMLGIECHAVVMNLPHPEGNRPCLDDHDLQLPTGNLLLDEILGVNLIRLPNGTWDELFTAMNGLGDDLRQCGARVEVIPVGGSTGLGAYGFLKAAEEISLQGQFDTVVCPTSSGSTHVGLAYGFRGSSTRVIGVSCDVEPDPLEDVELVSHALASLLFVSPLGRSEFLLLEGFGLPAYGVASVAGSEAATLLARREGIFLDPVYSAKAFAGLLQLAREHRLPGRTVFWHTGGMPTLFA